MYIYGLYSSGSTSYDKQRWRVVESSKYIELSEEAFFNDIYLEVGQSTTSLINENYSNVYWSDNTDFLYELTENNSVVSINTQTGEVSALESGITTISALHKVTGLVKYYYVFVFGEMVTVDCMVNESYNVKVNLGNNHPSLANTTWKISDSSVASINQLGVVTGLKTGYTFAYAVNENGNIVLMCEIKVMDNHTKMIESFTQNEIEYLYCPTSYLNIWTSELPDAFSLKVEILYTLRKYYTMPESEHPTQAEIRAILKNELNIETGSDKMAAAIFNECYLEYRGLYNQDYLTYLRKEYFNYLKEIVAFCAFSMASNLDPYTTGSQCNGYDDIVYDLSKEWGNNEKSHIVMLGSNGYQGKYYFLEAEKHGYRYFYSSDYDLFCNKYGIDFVKSVNIRFLQRALDAGCTFYFCSNPTTAPITSSLHMEYSYLYNYYLEQWGKVYFKYVEDLGYWIFSSTP